MPDIKYITIVDDHALFRKGLAALINFFPSYKVLFDASNGKDFISKLNPRHLPDIVLLDVSMPEMDGYETAQWLRINHPKVKVLALSTMDADTPIIRMIKNGAKGYVLKDAEPAELQLAFDEVIIRGYFFNDLVTRKVLQSVTEILDEQSPMHVFAGITEKEEQFLKLICTEKNYHQIAKEMFVSGRTIDGYRDALFKKTGVTTRVGLVLFAVKNKIIDL